MRTAFERIVDTVRDHIEISAILTVSVVVILLTFRSYGITNDEYLHVAYGEAVVDWYTSLGRDTSALEDNRTYYYGALFDAASEVVRRILPLNVYETKHLCNVLVGLLGVLAAYRIGDILGGRTAGILAAVSLLLAPRYYGHAFNNPKDIPFAVFYLWSVYNILRALEAFPRLSVSRALWTGLSIGAALGIRVGGVLLFAYAGLYFGLAWLLFRNTDPGRLTGVPFKRLALIGFFAIAVMLLSWPLAFVSPLTTPFEALTRFASFPDSHWSYFGGQYITSLDTPRTYLPTWLALTLPEHLLIGLVLGLVLVVTDVRSLRITRHTLQTGFLCFAAFFPIVYAFVTKPPLYDGMRHFLFVVPPLATLSGIAWSHGVKSVRAPIVWVLLGLGVVSFAAVSVEAIRLHPNQVVYFNHVVGGTVDGAWREYETDYWRHAQKQALQWISDHHGDRHERKIRVASRFIHNQHQVPDDVLFVDFRAFPDFYIGSTRYDEHKVVPGEVVHVIRAGREAELVYIIRPDDAYEYEPFFTNSFWADLHRRPIYLREAEHHEQGGNHPAAARAYLKLSRCYERLTHHAGRMTEPEASLITRARDYQARAVRLLPEEDAWTVAARYIDQGNDLAARDILLGLVAVYPDRPQYRETLIETLGRTGEHDLVEAISKE